MRFTSRAECDSFSSRPPNAMSVSFFSISFHTYSFGMHKELKYGFLKSLYFADEDSEAQISQKYAQIYIKTLPVD